MSSVYFLHVVTGTVGLITGFLALFVVKGATLHRRAGLAFVYSMLAMCIAGGFMAVALNKAAAINVPAATITSYLIITSLTTVRERWQNRAAEALLLLAALGVGSVMLIWGVQAVLNGGTRNGFPAFPFFLFAAFGLLGAAGDMRVMLRGRLTGARRLARHLWRMSMALLIAALSFAVQFVKLMNQRAGIRLPPATIAIPLLLILVALAYWMWRVRFRKSLRGLVLLNPSTVPVPSA